MKEGWRELAGLLAEGLLSFDEKATGYLGIPLGTFIVLAFLSLLMTIQAIMLGAL